MDSIRRALARHQPLLKFHQRRNRNRFTTTVAPRAASQMGFLPVLSKREFTLAGQDQVPGLLTSWMFYLRYLVRSELLTEPGLWMTLFLSGSRRKSKHRKFSSRRKLGKGALLNGQYFVLLVSCFLIHTIFSANSFPCSDLSVFLKNDYECSNCCSV